MSEEIKRGSDEWRAGQAAALVAMRALVSACHPFVPAMQLRDGTWRCGFMGDGDRRERECRQVIKPVRAAATRPTTPPPNAQAGDPARDAYAPEPPDHGLAET